MVAFKELTTWMALCLALTCWFWIMFIVGLMCTLQDLNEYKPTINRWFYVNLMFFMVWLFMLLIEHFWGKCKVKIAERQLQRRVDRAVETNGSPTEEDVRAIRVVHAREGYGVRTPV